MKKYIILLYLFTFAVCAEINIVVSVAPELTFAKAITGKKANISLMVSPGNSPHTYEPKPSQMIDIAKADLYLSIGVEFERVWLPKFKNQNRKMQIIDVSKGVSRQSIHINQAKIYKHNNNENLDPHIWTSPKNVKLIAKNILASISKIDKDNRAYYKKNYNDFISEITKVEIEINNILKSVPSNKKAFMVFHPAWGYFASQFGLTQVAIEIEGKAPKPKAIINLIKKAREQNISAILTSPEFSDNIAKQIASELKIPVVKISPLDENWSNNLINLAKTVSNPK